jgi:hypothetical protein
VFEPPLHTPPLMGRRSVLRLLGVAAVALVAGCRSGKQQAAPTSPDRSAAPPTGSPIGSPRAGVTPTLPTTAATSVASAAPTPAPLSGDQLVAQRVAVAEEALLAAYDASAAAHPELAGRLAPFRADHAAHLHGLAPGVAPPSSAPSSTAPAPVASAAAPASSPPASVVFEQLADLERNAAAARVNDVATTSGSLARLIASIGGCEAAHAALLSVAT